MREGKKTLSCYVDQAWTPAYTSEKHNRRKELSVTPGLPYPDLHPTHQEQRKHFIKMKLKKQGPI